MCLLLPLPPYVCDWARRHYGDPALFPPRSWARCALALGLTDRPRSPRPPRGGGFLRVCRPDVPGRRAARFRHLTAAGEAAAADAVTCLFLCDLYFHTLPRVASGGFLAALWAWCEASGIPPRHRGAVRQRLYRARADLARRGVLLVVPHRRYSAAGERGDK